VFPQNHHSHGGTAGLCLIGGGSANREHETLCTEWQSTYDDSDGALTPQLTPSSHEALMPSDVAGRTADPNLAIVVKVWDTLPESARAAIATLAMASGQSRG